MLPHLPINSFHHQFYASHHAGKLKLPADKVTVVTAWSPQFSQNGENCHGSQFVFGPGEEIIIDRNKQGWIHGYQYPVVPHVPQSELQKVRAEFEATLTAEGKKYEAKLEEVKALLKAASVAALKEASLAVLTKAVAGGVVDQLPDKLADAIQSVVDEAVKRAMERAGRP
jgi:hypothetical protein